jgi:ribA/ribD-fused uncharacterized protein
MASGYPLFVSGVRILSSEALYQCCRFPHLPKVQQEIIEQTSPMTAKMKSKPHRDQTREDWEEVKVAIMKWCIKLKLVEHWSRFSALLLSTDSKPIVELSRRDAFWGAILSRDGKTLVGANVLGRLLMDIRERVKADPDAFSTVFPLPISNFTILGRPIEPVCCDINRFADSPPQQKQLMF